MVGIDHNQATLDVRALFSFTKKNMHFAMEQLNKIEGIQGCVILSTCNRMELWVSAKEDWNDSLYELLCQVKKVEPKEYRKFFRERNGQEAVNHIFRLACGLKSQILGEDQIITQVREALAFAREKQMSDSVLEVLFRKAVTAGKKVKTEVVFPRGNVSVINNALLKLEEQNIQIKDKKCMVIGNGEMGKIAARAFVDAGAKVLVTVRQYRHGMVEIPNGCQEIDYHKREEYLEDCDFIISATTSPHKTLTKKMLQKAQAVKEQSDKAQILIDLAVPRDIEIEVEQIKDVTLYDIDDFKSVQSDETLQQAIDQAEKILQTQIVEFYQWLGGYKIMPRIQFIKDEAVNDLNLRIEKSVQNISMGEDERFQLISTINKAAEKVVNKMIFKLRDDLEEKEFFNCIESLEQLYEEE